MRLVVIMHSLAWFQGSNKKVFRTFYFTLLDRGGRIDVGQIHYSSKVTPYTEMTSKEDGFIYKFNASWEAKDGLMFYAQAAQGFRPGGVNQVIGLIIAAVFGWAVIATTLFAMARMLLATAQV